MNHKSKFSFESPFSWQDLIALIDFLNSPDGCPWDAAQTHHSLAPYFLEETYEAIDAIQRGDAADLCEELGDVLMQIAFHIVLGERAGTFNRQKVVDGICEKLIRRHSHVFGDDVVQDEADLVTLWTQHKSAEHKDNKLSVLERVPLSMPALLRAKELQKKAARLQKMASVDQVQETKDLVARINEYGTAFRELLTGSDQDALRLYKTEIEPEEESDSRCSQSELEQCIGNMLLMWYSWRDWRI